MLVVLAHGWLIIFQFQFQVPRREEAAWNDLTCAVAFGVLPLCLFDEDHIVGIFFLNCKSKTHCIAGMQQKKKQYNKTLQNKH